MKKNIVQIAAVCHEANRMYCFTIGDQSQPSWDDAPDWQKKSAEEGVVFHLNALNSGVKPTPSASHDSWLAEKERDGWKYGPVKDAEKKEHPCYVPYDQLPLNQRMKDYIFSSIVEAFYNGLNS
jgi:hypothetical protein